MRLIRPSHLSYCRVSIELLVIHLEEIPRWITDRPRLVASAAEFLVHDIVEKRPFQQEAPPAAHGCPAYDALVIDLEDELLLIVAHDLHLTRLHP
jgi:hypothetical protein